MEQRKEVIFEFGNTKFNLASIDYINYFDQLTWNLKIKDLVELQYLLKEIRTMMFNYEFLPETPADDLVKMLRILIWVEGFFTEEAEIVKDE